MNIIKIDNNNIKYDGNDIIISDSSIIFKNNGEYFFELINCKKFNRDIIIEDNISVNLFIWSKNNKINNDIHYILGSNSILDMQQFYSNDSANENVVVDLNGVNSKYIDRLSSVCRGVEDYNMVINHNNHGVSSYISNKCIGYDGASIKFNIDSVVDRGNDGCVMDQSTKILTFGDVNTSIKPNMFIEEDNVEARHGSVVSNISYDDVFYLMSRGISYDDAVSLLSVGFILSNLNVDDKIREDIISLI